MSDMLYTEIRENLPEDFQMLLMARENLLPQLVDNDLVCLPMPARAGDLVQTVAMMQNAVEIRVKKRKSRPKARSKEDMEALSAAKALLMARNNMTEPEAHRYIQKTAMDTGTSLVETAQMALDLFNDKIPGTALAVGQHVDVYFGIRTREYNGKVYNDINVFKFN